MIIRRLFERPAARCFAALAVFSCSVLLATNTAPELKSVQGVLIDKECSPRAETRLVSGANPHLEGGMLWAYTHTRQCLLMPACLRSGYGVFTYDTSKFLSFDVAGNQKALALIRASKKQDDMRVEVTGEIAGDKIKVSTLKFLP